MTTATLDEIAAEIGDVGQRLWQIGAAEGAAGNVSVFVHELAGRHDRFIPRGLFALPIAARALAGGWLIVTGSGQRLRDIAARPDATLCLLQIQTDGLQAMLYTGKPLRPTSELNSHLAIHSDHVARRNLGHHAVVHAQPLRLSYLSHIPRYLEPTVLSQRLLRWQAETIMEFPEGIGALPFEVPGSLEQATMTAEALRHQRAVVWARHGIVTRADSSVGKAGDLVEYAEAAAQYEYLNLQAGEPTSGLAPDEIRLIAARLGIEQHIF